jgi:hypothetical protein
MPKDEKTSNPPPKPWQEKMDPNFHLRVPRTGVGVIETLLGDCASPAVFLAETDQHTDIVIRFSATSKKLPEEVRAAYFTPTFTIEKAFDEVLRRVPGKKSSRTMRAQITQPVYNAYRAVWLHVLTTLYLNQFHPKSDAYLRADIEHLKVASKAKRGRSDSSADRDNRMKKYESMLLIAELFHRTATEVVRKNLPTNARLIAEQIDKEIWEITKDDDLSRSLYGPRAAELIFSGKAFKDMAVSNPAVSIAQPSGWKPGQLALALLNGTELKPYRMVDGKLKEVLSKKSAKR